MNEDWERHNSAENEGILVSLISKDGDCGKCLEERGRKGGKGRRAVWMNGVNHELDARMEDWIIIFIMSSLQMAVFSYSFGYINRGKFAHFSRAQICRFVHKYDSICKCL